MIHHLNSFHRTFLQLRSQGDRNEDLRLLREMVKINSQTRHCRGVNKLQSLLTEVLCSMGFNVELIPHPQGRFGSLLVARLEGKTTRTISLVAHADTVLPSENGFQRVEEKDAIIIKGSGIIDNKGGILVALRGLRNYLERVKIPGMTLQFICSPNEEVGSTGFHNHLRELGMRSDIVLGFEPALNNGNLIHSRNGNRWYKIKVKGQSSHAGRFQERQMNAAHELSSKIHHLHQLNDYSRRTKVNVGCVSGGRDLYNMVCGEAEAKIDTRFATEEDRDRLHQEIVRILDASYINCFVSGDTCTTTYTIEDDCPPFAGHGESSPMLKLYQKMVGEVEGRTPDWDFSGGAADINYLAFSHNMAMDGLGPVGGGMHTDQEFVLESSLWTRAEALERFLLQWPAPLVLVTN